MDLQDRLVLLGRAARFDDCVTPPGSAAPARGAAACALRAGTGDPAGPGQEFGLFAGPETGSGGPDLFPYVSHVQVPGGGSLPVLKVLQTNACQNDCRYCAFRAGRDVRRARFTPDELARAFDLMYRAGVVRGIFLSSAVAGSVRTMDEMLATAELVRGRYQFRGYLHLKLLPGAEPAQIARAVELADRVSANLEAPTPEHLEALAPHKGMASLEGLLRAAARLIPPRAAGAAGREAAGVGHARLGISTQFVVGPAGESDRDLLLTAQRLYREARLARAYYSAFSPVPGTPLEDAPPTDPCREFRLYQADWHLRYYGLSAQELSFDAQGGLEPGVDPKTAWARRHPECFPVEVNRAPLSELLRIPGIGPVSARAILAARRQGTLRELGDLRRLGARADRAAPYVLLAGRRPPHQMSLW